MEIQIIPSYSRVIEVFILFSLFENFNPPHHSNATWYWNIRRIC